MKILGMEFGSGTAVADDQQETKTLADRLGAATSEVNQLERRVNILRTVIADKTALENRLSNSASGWGAGSDLSLAKKSRAANVSQELAALNHELGTVEKELARARARVESVERLVNANPVYVAAIAKQRELVTSAREVVSRYRAWPLGQIAAIENELARLGSDEIQLVAASQRELSEAGLPGLTPKIRTITGKLALQLSGINFDGIEREASEAIRKLKDV